MAKSKKYSSFNLSKKGITPLQQMQIRQMAHIKDKEIQEEAFRRTIVISIMAFIEAYKRKPSTKKVQEYFSYCMALYSEFGDDTYTMNDVKKYLESVGIEYGEYIKEN